MTPAPLNFHLSVQSALGIPEPGKLEHQTTASLTDTMLTVQTATSKGWGVRDWPASNGQLQLGGQWPRTVKKCLAMTKASTRAPDFDAGAWISLAPTQAPERPFHYIFRGDHLGCALRLEAPDRNPLYWTDKHFKAMWMEVAQSLTAAAAGKDLSLRFISVTTAGQRREMRVTQHTQDRTATVETYIDAKLVERAATDIETYLEVHELVVFLRGYNTFESHNRRDDSAALADERRHHRSFAQRLFQRGGKPAGAGSFFFTPVVGNEDLVVSWTEARTGGPLADNQALLAKLRGLQGITQFPIEIPSDSD